MEVRNRDVCIKVDNKQFVLDENARQTLEGAMAFIMCALQTRKHEQLNVAMCHVLSRILLEHEREKGNSW